MVRWIASLTVVIGIIAIPETAVAQRHVNDVTTSEMSRVRSRNPGLSALIGRASEASPTFRHLVETIDASDGIVYVDPGVCRYAVRACLVKVAAVNARRFVFVKVYVKRTDRQLMAAIGHELQHAIELLSDPSVTNHSTMYFFYKFNHERLRTSTAFETKSAIEAARLSPMKFDDFSAMRYRISETSGQFSAEALQYALSPSRSGDG
jgi:hypothetical protein